MSAAVAERPMATKRNDTTAKIDVEVLARAKIAATVRGMTLAEYLSEIVMERANLDIDEWTKKEAGKKPKR